MPLARIVTRFPEQTLAASDYLRSQGYTVETISPGDFRVTPAAFELKLDKCTPDEALLRAQQALREFQEHEASIGEKAETSPETPVEDARVPTAYDITGRPVEFEGEARPERRRAPRTFGRALVSLLDRAWADTDSRLTEAWGSVIGTLRPHERRRTDKPAAEPGAALAETRTAEEPSPEAGNQARASAMPMPSLEELRAREEAEREAQERELQARLATERAAQLERLRLQDEAEVAAERERQKVAAERVAELARRREEERLAAAQRVAEEREQARIAAEEQERERQRLAAEEEAQERERQRVAALHEAMIAADEERARRAAEQQAANQAAEEARPQPPPAAIAAPPPMPQLLSQPTRPQPDLRRSEDLPPRGWERGLNPIREREWKKAFAAAAAIAIVVAGGIVAYANRRPASPLSNHDLTKSQTIQQQAPFGAATVVPAPPPKPSPAVLPAVQKPAPVKRPARASSSNRKPVGATRPARRLRHSSDQADDVAEDEVVVRRLQKAQAVAPTRAAAGLKRYSDMN